jgi:PAS domain-containing protein
MKTGQIARRRKPQPETFTGEDLVGPKRTELELRQACIYAQAIVEAVPPMLVLDADLRVKTADESFYQHFRVSHRTDHRAQGDRTDGSNRWRRVKAR